MNFSTSLICCKMHNVGSDVENILKASNGDERFSWFHADFMDGHFVPRLGISPELIKDLKLEFKDRIHIDSHLMISDPFEYSNVIAPYSDWLIFHYEAVTDPIRTLQKMRKLHPNVKIGLAYNLATPINFYIVDMLKNNDLIDGIMLMGISPGVLGTNSYPNIVLEKLNFMKSLDVSLFIDGSVNFKTIPEYGKFNKMTIVCGSSSMLKVDDVTKDMSRYDLIATNIKRIKEAINE